METKSKYNTNEEMAELRKEMNEKKAKMMREVKNSRRAQSIHGRSNNGQTTSRRETPRHINNDDGEINASDHENKKRERRIIL